MKKLVIAEKPSVAKDLARVLGRIPKNGDFYENDEWIIDSAVGHLVELFMPDDFDKKLKAWKPKSSPQRNQTPSFRPPNPKVSTPQ